MATLTRAVSRSFEVLPQTQPRSNPKYSLLTPPECVSPVPSLHASCHHRHPDPSPLPPLTDLSIPRAPGSALPLPVPLRPEGDPIPPEPRPSLPRWSPLPLSSQGPTGRKVLPPSCPVRAPGCLQPTRPGPPHRRLPGAHSEVLQLWHACQVLLCAARDRVSHVW